VLAAAGMAVLYVLGEAFTFAANATERARRFLRRR
jgi:putative flippase GtrA